MRRVVLTLAAIVVVGLATRTALAGNWYGGGYGHQNFDHYYGFRYCRPPAIGYGLDPQTEAEMRIKAAHSRYRYYTHPLSLYNSPPTMADYFGWQFGY